MGNGIAPYARSLLRMQDGSILAGGGFGHKRRPERAGVRGNRRPRRFWGQRRAFSFKQPGHLGQQQFHTHILAAPAGAQRGTQHSC